MLKDKYTLPIVDSLKGIGFQFEYSKQSDAIPYIKNFIVDNLTNLQPLYIFKCATYDESGNIIELDIENNPDGSSEVLAKEPEKELVAKIERIKGGKINPRDYLFHVHPIHANNPEVLVNVFTKKLSAKNGQIDHLSPV
jgi:hypothetical protein